MTSEPTVAGGPEDTRPSQGSRGARDERQEEQAQQDRVAESSSGSRETGDQPDLLRTRPTEKLEVHDEDVALEPKPKSPGIMERVGLTPPVLITMFKGSLPPLIGIAIYQAATIKTIFTNLGYLIPIISVLCLTVLPRGKYIQNLILNLFAACLGSAVAILALWSSVQARLHTSDLAELQQYYAEHGVAPYNSSQSAVCAVWLFANIWFVNVVRAKLPSFNIAVIIYSIVVNISCTFGPMIPTVSAVELLIKELLTAILLGLALSTGVSLFVVPISSRMAVTGQMKGAIGLLRKALSLEKEYLRGLERADMYTLELSETTAGAPNPRKTGKKGQKEHFTREQKTALALRDTISGVREVMGKIHGDIKFAKRDVAWGSLSAEDLGEIFTLLRAVMIPLIGISTIMDIFQRVAQARGWATTDDVPPEVIADRAKEQQVWNDVMKQLHEPFEILSQAIDQGLEHAGISLELLPRPKDQKRKAAKKASATDAANVEALGGNICPGQLGFDKIIDEKMQIFYSRKGEIVRMWAKERGLSSDGAPENWDQDKSHLFEERTRDQAQLFMLLYLEKLMQATGEAVEDLIAFADAKVEDGTMGRKRLIIPTERRLRKWFFSVFRADDSTAEESPDLMERGINVVFVGDSFAQKKDPEHLPARTAWQHFGNGLRAVSRFLGSPESAFGFRVACATMTIGIVAFLEQSQPFFTQQRLVWAMIIIAIGMTQTSGQSIFGFLCRVVGTLIAMITSFIIWYIVDGKTPGVIVFLWLFVFVEYYFFIKFPQFIPAVLICIVTQVLIIGYELQVRSLGIAASEASGQPYYPIYELAPYRLATVAGGSLIAFFWTIFPSPFTDRTWLRKDLSAVLYLLANYFSAINTTMRAVITQTAGDVGVEGSPAHSLHKVRRKIWGKLSLLLPSLQQHASFEKFEPNIGGKFPEDSYQDIILRCTRIMNYLTLISYVLTWVPHHEPREESDSAWLDAFSGVMHEISPTHHTILSTLTLLSNSLLSGQSLPPFLPLPKPYELTRKLLRMGEEHRPLMATGDDDDESSSPSTSSSADEETGGSDANNTRKGTSCRNAKLEEAWNLLDARNMEQKGYTEFAVLQVCSTLIIGDVEGLVRTVSDLVGTVDFSFRIDNSNDSSIESVDRIVSRATMRAARTRTATGLGMGRGVARGKKGKGKVD